MKINGQQRTFHERKMKQLNNKKLQLEKNLFHETNRIYLIEKDNKIQQSSSFKILELLFNVVSDSCEDLSGRGN